MTGAVLAKCLEHERKSPRLCGELIPIVVVADRERLLGGSLSNWLFYSRTMLGSGPCVCLVIGR